MESRWHMSNSKVMVEAPYTEDGRMELDLMRKSMGEFKYARIKQVLQAEPSKVELLRIYLMEER